MGYRTQREVIRLIVSLATRHLSEEENSILQNAIIEGPAKDRFREDLEDAQRAYVIDRMKWLRLKKFVSNGGTPIPETTTLLSELAKLYPNWVLATDDRDEFPFWSLDGEESLIVREAPKSIETLVEWLRDYPDPNEFHEKDNWSELCIENFGLAAVALGRHAKEQYWPTGRWRQALQAWSNRELAPRYWRWLGNILTMMPADKFSSDAQSIARCINANASNTSATTDNLFHLINRIIECKQEEPLPASDAIVDRAINHPIGVITEAALKWWYNQGLEDNQGLHSNLENLFNRISSADHPILH